MYLFLRAINITSFNIVMHLGKPCYCCRLLQSMTIQSCIYDLHQVHLTFFLAHGQAVSKPMFFFFLSFQNIGLFYHIVEFAIMGKGIRKTKVTFKVISSLTSVSYIHTLILSLIHVIRFKHHFKMWSSLPQTDRSNIRYDKSHVEGHKMIKVAIIIILSILIDFWNKRRKQTCKWQTYYWQNIHKRTSEFLNKHFAITLKHNII